MTHCARPIVLEASPYLGPLRSPALLHSRRRRIQGTLCVNFLFSLALTHIPGDIASVKQAILDCEGLEGERLEACWHQVKTFGKVLPQPEFDLFAPVRLRRSDRPRGAFCCARRLG